MTKFEQELASALLAALKDPEVSSFTLPIVRPCIGENLDKVRVDGVFDLYKLAKAVRDQLARSVAVELEVARARRLPGQSNDQA